MALEDSENRAGHAALQITLQKFVSEVRLDCVEETEGRLQMTQEEAAWCLLDDAPEESLKYSRDTIAQMNDRSRLHALRMALIRLEDKRPSPMVPFMDS